MRLWCIHVVVLRGNFSAACFMFFLSSSTKERINYRPAGLHGLKHFDFVPKMMHSMPAGLHGCLPRNSTTKHAPCMHFVAITAGGAAALEDGQSHALRIVRQRCILVFID